MICCLCCYDPGSEQKRKDPKRHKLITALRGGFLEARTGGGSCSPIPLYFKTTLPPSKLKAS